VDRIDGCIYPPRDQVVACQGDARPQIENVVALRELAGIRVTYRVADSDDTGGGSYAYINNAGGGGCGGWFGELSYFHNFAAFPASVRVVAWDTHGCMAEPVCLTIQ
jgi:hypothetical protein